MKKITIEIVTTQEAVLKAIKEGMLKRGYPEDDVDIPFTSVCESDVNDYLLSDNFQVDEDDICIT